MQLLKALQVDENRLLQSKAAGLRSRPIQFGSGRGKMLDEFARRHFRREAWIRGSIDRGHDGSPYNRGGERIPPSPRAIYLLDEPKARRLLRVIEYLLILAWGHEATIAIVL
jgi:hypothetical protein